MKTPDPFPYRPEAFKPIPCPCGNPDAEWHGDRRGYRAFCCIECWQDDPNGNEVWVTHADLVSNYSNE